MAMAPRLTGSKRERPRTKVTHAAQLGQSAISEKISHKWQVMVQLEGVNVFSEAAVKDAVVQTIGASITTAQVQFIDAWIDRTSLLANLSR